MRIDEIIARKTHRGYLMVQLREKSSDVSRWQILHEVGGMKSHQGYAPTEEAARAKVDELIAVREHDTSPRRGF